MNGYAYVNGDPVNLTDPSGLCPRVNGGNAARECEFLRDDLRAWGVNVIYDFRNTIIDTGTCLSDQVVRAANQADVRQRWTLSEMSSIHSAFVVFSQARSTIGFEALYPWPLGASGVTIEKRNEIRNNALGIHDYGERLITMSATQWGETSALTVGGTPIGNVYRTWLILHEFSHIFVKDRTPQGLEAEFYATHPQHGLPGLIAARFGRVVPTGYATESEQERAIEVVTATLWNNGYTAITGFDSGAGGRTAPIGGTAQDRYAGSVFNLTNVRDVVAQGETLEQWVIANVMLRNP